MLFYFLCGYEGLGVGHSGALAQLYNRLYESIRRICLKGAQYPWSLHGLFFSLALSHPKSLILVPQPLPADDRSLAPRCLDWPMLLCLSERWARACRGAASSVAVSEGLVEGPLIPGVPWCSWRGTILVRIRFSTSSYRLNDRTVSLTSSPIWKNQAISDRKRKDTSACRDYLASR